MNGISDIPLMAGRILFGVFLLANSGGSAWAQQSAEPKEQNARVFSGVVEAVDTKAAKVTVKTDIGKDVELDVVKPELLADIDKGDRITVTVDDKQRATKIMKSIPIPELKSPAGESPSAPEEAPK